MSLIFLARTGLRRRRLLLSAFRQHAIELDVQIQQLAAQVIEALLEIANVFLGRDVYEIENCLDVAIEGLLVGQELFAGAPEPGAQPVITHNLIKERRNAFLAHLTELGNQIFSVAL